MSSNTDPKHATEATRARNRAVHDMLPLGDTTDFELARRGLISAPEEPRIAGRFGLSSWDFESFSFIEGVAPDTVNPSLWRQAQLNNVAGLFEVADGFYQVRGFDLSNITFVATDSGWIVIDPLTSTETARSALALVHAHLPARPIHTVIYTHSHVDHFAGVRGVIDEGDVERGDVRIYAPEGFLRHAVLENVIAGNVMTRRGMYMYGALLPRGPRGHVDAGLGKAVPALGTRSLIAPTDEITDTGTEIDFDGVRVVFQLTPGTEAPAEMNFFFPEHRVLCMAENCTATLHNIYTLRGAQIRDALAWSKYVDEAIEWFGTDTDVMFASHHWPRWGKTEVIDYLTKQRDLYRYIHDQTMRLANHGLTPTEIAEEIELPPTLRDEFFNRDYYGTVNHNVKGVYQHYLGWFDGNPANLHPLSPATRASRYVDYMGGSEEVLGRAREAFDAGDYRWVAEVVNHVVFAEPDNTEARLLQADTLEQLGYQSESGPWRSFYLTAAQELRHGAPKGLPSISVAEPDVTSAMTSEMLLDLIGVSLDGPGAAADGAQVELNVVISDRDENWHVGIDNGTLHARRDHYFDDADASVSLTHSALALIAARTADLDELFAYGELAIEGDADALARFVSYLQPFDSWFNIIEP